MGWLALGMWVQPRAWAINDDDEFIVVVAMGNKPVGPHTCPVLVQG